MRKLWFTIVEVTGYSVTAIINGKEYTYFLDGAGIPYIEILYKKGNKGKALTLLKQRSYAVKKKE